MHGQDVNGHGHAQNRDMDKDTDMDMDMVGFPEFFKYSVMLELMVFR